MSCRIILKAAVFRREMSFDRFCFACFNCMLAAIGAISVTALGILSRMASFETLGFFFLFVLAVQQANPARKMPQGSLLGLLFFSVCLNSVLLT